VSGLFVHETGQIPHFRVEERQNPAITGKNTQIPKKKGGTEVPPAGFPLPEYYLPVPDSDTCCVVGFALSVKVTAPV
jgi:hypothetical protein